MQALRRLRSSQRELAVLPASTRLRVRCDVATRRRRPRCPVERRRSVRGLEAACRALHSGSAGIVFACGSNRPHCCSPDALGGRIIDRGSGRFGRSARGDPLTLVRRSPSSASVSAPCPSAPSHRRPGLIDKSGQLIFAQPALARCSACRDCRRNSFGAGCCRERHECRGHRRARVRQLRGRRRLHLWGCHSGVGGAIFVGGRLYAGAEGLAGEFVISVSCRADAPALRRARCSSLRLRTD